MWRFRYTTALAEKHKEQAALHHHQRVVVGRCVHAWTVYVERQQYKAQRRGERGQATYMYSSWNYVVSSLSATAVRVHRKALLWEHLMLWRRRAVRRRELRQFEQLLEVRGHHARKVRMFAAWRHCKWVRGCVRMAAT